MRERGLHWHLHPYVAHGCEEAIKVTSMLTIRGLSRVTTLTTYAISSPDQMLFIRGFCARNLTKTILFSLLYNIHLE